MTNRQIKDVVPKAWAALPSDFSFPAAYGDLFAVEKAVFAEQSKGCAFVGLTLYTIV